MNHALGSFLKKTAPTCVWDGRLLGPFWRVFNDGWIYVSFSSDVLSMTSAEQGQLLDIGDVMAFRVAGCSVQMARATQTDAFGLVLHPMCLLKAWKPCALVIGKPTPALGCQSVVRVRACYRLWYLQWACWLGLMAGGSPRLNQAAMNRMGCTTAKKSGRKMVSCGATSKMQARSNRSFMVPSANFLNWYLQLPARPRRRGHE